MFSGNKILYHMIDLREQRWKRECFLAIDEIMGNYYQVILGIGVQALLNEIVNKLVTRN